AVSREAPVGRITVTTKLSGASRSDAVRLASRWPPATLSEIARRHTIRYAAVPQIGMREPLLNLRRGWALPDVAVPTLEPATVTRTRDPRIAGTNIGTIEAVVIDEIVIDDDVTVAPVEAPSPTAATRPKRAHGHPGCERDCTRGDQRAGRRI